MNVSTNISTECNGISFQLHLTIILLNLFLLYPDICVSYAQFIWSSVYPNHEPIKINSILFHYNTSSTMRIVTNMKGRMGTKLKFSNLQHVGMSRLFCKWLRLRDTCQMVHNRYRKRDSEYTPILAGWRCKWI